MELIKYAADTLWDQQYGVSISEAEILRINAIFHSESELIPTIQRSKRYFKVFRLKILDVQAKIVGKTDFQASCLCALVKRTDDRIRKYDNDAEFSRGFSIICQCWIERVVLALVEVFGNMEPVEFRGLYFSHPDLLEVRFIIKYKEFF